MNWIEQAIERARKYPTSYRVSEEQRTRLLAAITTDYPFTREHALVSFLEYTDQDGHEAAIAAARTWNSKNQQELKEAFLEGWKQRRRDGDSHLRDFLLELLSESPVGSHAEYLAVQMSAQYGDERNIADAMARSGMARCPICDEILGIQCPASGACTACHGTGSGDHDDTKPECTECEGTGNAREAASAA